MTKKQFDSLEEATQSNDLHNWLCDHEAELSKSDVLIIARELASATFNPFATGETQVTYFVKEQFLNELNEHYEVYGWDEEDE